MYTLSSYLGLSFEEERVSMLRQVRALRHAGDHLGLLTILGVRLDGSPATRDGLEVLLVTPKCHFFVTLNRLLCWTRENNREVSGNVVHHLASLHMLNPTGTYQIYFNPQRD